MKVAALSFSLFLWFNIAGRREIEVVTSLPVRYTNMPGGMIFVEDNEPGRIGLSTPMMSYWAQFAYTGDPERGRDGSLPRWKAWDPRRPDADKFIVLDTAGDGGIRMSSETESPEALLTELASDPRLDSADERCVLFERLNGWWPLVVPASSASDLGCGATF